jgi:hypothetical protein
MSATEPSDDVITTPEAFREAVRWGVDQALARRSRLLRLCDPDFADWPLDEAAVLDALTAFVRLPGRRVRFMAADYRRIQLSMPRLCAWRRTWGHALDTLSPVQEGTPLKTALLADRTHGVLIAQRDPLRGWREQAAQRLSLLADQLDAHAQRCEPAWPSTTLGL